MNLILCQVYLNTILQNEPYFSYNNPNNLAYEVDMCVLKAGEKRTIKKRTISVLCGDVPPTPPQTVRNMMSGTI